MVAGFGLLAARRRRTGLAVIALAWVGLWCASLPVVATRLAGAWENVPALTRPFPAAQAIVVLAAGRYHRAPEYGGRTTVGADTLLRLRYTARLYRETHLPILASGGAPLGGKPASLLMRHVLTRDFGTPVKWVEASSRTTAENAAYSAAILKRLDIRTILLVTQAWHMRRAAALFRRAGFTVIPAPTGFATPSPRGPTLLAYLPSAQALALCAVITHEAIGLAWVHIQTLLPQTLAHFIGHG